MTAIDIDANARISRLRSALSLALAGKTHLWDSEKADWVPLAEWALAGPAATSPTIGEALCADGIHDADGTCCPPGSRQAAESEVVNRTEVARLTAKVDELTAELEQTREQRDLNSDLLDGAARALGIDLTDPDVHYAFDIPTKVAEVVAALTASRENAANLANENGRLVAENARLTNELEHRRAEVEELRATLQGPVPADGPWKAFIVHEGWAVDDLSDLAPDDEVDIVIVRDTALPDAEGHMAGTYKSDDVAFEVEVGALKAELERMRAVVEAAKYEYGGMWCLDGECDHEVASDDAPCPMVETRYATAAEILAVEALLMSTDGDPLDDADEIPVGEIRRVLGEAREAATR